MEGPGPPEGMDTAGCMGAKCGTLKTQDITTAKTCNVKKAVQENHDGCMLSTPYTRFFVIRVRLTSLLGLTTLPGSDMAQK
jgi:hypothetical protein